MKFRAKPKEQEIVEAVQLKGEVDVVSVLPSNGFTNAMRYMYGPGDWLVVSSTGQQFLSDKDFRAAYVPLEGVDTSPVELGIAGGLPPGVKTMAEMEADALRRITRTPWCPACERPVATTRPTGPTAVGPCSRACYFHACKPCKERGWAGIADEVGEVRK